MTETRIKQSSIGWLESINIAWLIDNAQFAFIDKFSKNRVSIVTKKKINGSNCFELDNDQYGAIVSAVSIYSSATELDILEKAKTKAEIIEMIDVFYWNWGAIDIINPKTTLKLFWNILRGKCKIVLIKH